MVGACRSAAIGLFAQMGLMFHLQCFALQVGSKRMRMLAKQAQHATAGKAACKILWSFTWGLVKLNVGNKYVFIK